MLTANKAARAMILATCLGIGLGLATTAAAKSATQYTYDALGRVTKVDYGAGKFVSYSYDSAGNRTNVSTTGFPPGKFVVLPLLGGLVIPIPN